MLHKLRQQLTNHNKTPGNRVPNKRARAFILNTVRAQRLLRPTFWMRATLGFTRWLCISSGSPRSPRHRAECFITGRSRGTSQRFTIARTKIKELSGQARLFGVRKASW